MNFKRKHSRRSVRCTMCTPHRWRGNHADRFDHQQEKADEAYKQALKEVRTR